MKPSILIYSILLAIFAVILEIISIKYSIHSLGFEKYAIVIAIVFMITGIFVGTKLLNAKTETLIEQPTNAPDKNNILQTGISPRELEVLSFLALGNSNKIIARQLKISPNTVKTHIGKIFEKLEVDNRTKAINRAKELKII